MNADAAARTTANSRRSPSFTQGNSAVRDVFVRLAFATGEHVLSHLTAFGDRRLLEFERRLRPLRFPSRLNIPPDLLAERRLALERLLLPQPLPELDDQTLAV